MDDGEVEPLAHRGDDSSENFQNSDEFLDEFLNGSRTCTHTHTCNPPGPDTAHTHTCFHTHTRTKVFSSDDKSSKTSKRPLGNREAVRKYREKKKAHTAYLEEEVKKLRSLNQQLFRKLQGQAALESEISRLRSLLFDIRGKIDIQLADYPFQSQCIAVNNISSVSKAGNGCGVQCDSSRLQSNIIGLSSQTQQMNGNGDALGSWEDQVCQNAVLECRVNGIEGSNGGTQVEQ